MPSTDLEKEYPVLTHEKVDAKKRSIFWKEIRSFQKTIEENKDTNAITNAKAALAILKRKDYVDKIGIYHLIYFQQGRQVSLNEIKPTDEKGPVNHVVSSAKQYYFLFQN